MSAGVRGYGLIEMMIAIAIVAVLAVLGTPMYVSWLSSTRIRSAAESVQNGLRLARTDAVQSARPARFELAAGGAGWTVCVPRDMTPDTCASPQSTSQSHDAQDGFARVRVGATADAAVPLNSDVSTLPAGQKGVTFNAFGRVLAGTTALTKIDISSDAAGARRLVTSISPGGSVRLCDPALRQSEHPQGCEG